MMESAERWRRQNAMYCSRQRRVLADRKMRASRVIVGRVRSQQMAKMPLAEHDNVVKTFPPDRTDRPFTISVLPRRSRRGWPIPNAHRPKAADEDVTVDGVAVTNDVSRRYFPTIGLGELVRNPFSRWVRGHSQPQDLAAIVLQNQQPVECEGTSSTQSLRRFTSQHVELMTKRQDLCLQRRSRPEQSDQRQANQAANISYQPRASPDSTSLASRIEFPTMTGPGVQQKGRRDKAPRRRQPEED